MPLRIYIVTQNQERIKLEADRRETFLKLKNLIKNIKGYNVSNQKILLNGIEMIDQDCVAPLIDGQVLDLVII